VLALIDELYAGRCRAYRVHVLGTQAKVSIFPASSRYSYQITAFSQRNHPDGRDELSPVYENNYAPSLDFFRDLGYIASLQMEFLPPQVSCSIGHNSTKRVRYLKCSSPLCLGQATYAVTGSLSSIFLAKTTKCRQLRSKDTQTR
jgi:hypothetical protein